MCFILVVWSKGILTLAFVFSNSIDLASQDPSSGSDQDEATLLKTSAVWAELPVINTCMVEIREIDVRFFFIPFPRSFGN